MTIDTETERPLPSERMDAAAARLKAEQPAEPERKKGAKNPAYIVLRMGDLREHEGFHVLELLTPQPVLASSRKDAIRKVAPADGAGSTRFVVIAAGEWQEIARVVKPRDGFEEAYE